MHGARNLAPSSHFIFEDKASESDVKPCTQWELVLFNLHLGLHATPDLGDPRECVAGDAPACSVIGLAATLASCVRTMPDPSVGISPTLTL